MVKSFTINLIFELVFVLREVQTKRKIPRAAWLSFEIEIPTCYSTKSEFMIIFLSAFFLAAILLKSKQTELLWNKCLCLVRRRHENGWAMAHALLVRFHRFLNNSNKLLPRIYSKEKKKGSKSSRFGSAWHKIGSTPRESLNISVPNITCLG